jgi:F-type H+-transporting ATPase subunit gamma
MPNLIDLRRRIKSVKNTQQITKAMKTVSTAKFKKAQRVVLEGRPLWHEAPDVLAQLSRWAGAASHPLFAVREEKRIWVIVLTSDKGLCGAFNSNLLTAALEFIRGKARGADVRLILIGKKAANFFRKQPFRVEKAYADKTDRLGDADFAELAARLAREFTFQDMDAVYAVYNEFKSVLAPRILIVRLLPVARPDAASATSATTRPSLTAESTRSFLTTESAGSVTSAPDWEPAAPALLAALVPRYLEDQLRHFYGESQAAEQAARMMAMDSASQNAEELIGDLVLVLNKIRQASITKELLEITSAVEAMKK